jgi:membrane protease subunit (stomatin/prohibitin family)
VNIFRRDVEREFIAMPDQFKGQLVFKWPDTNIRSLTQLTVEQDEAAVFFRDGKVVGTIGAGVSTLSSSEIPFLGSLVDAETGGNYFKTELYFIATREFPGLPFGGMIDNVVDPETNLAVGLRVFGDYSLRVIEPQALIVNLVGTQNVATNDQVTDWMRDMLLKVLREDVVTHISATGWPILGIAAHNDQIEQEVLAGVQPLLAGYGLALVRMGNFTISIKPEDEETLKKFRRDVQYTRLAGSFQQAAAGEALEGIGEGAASGAGASGPAVLGVGLGMSGLMGGAGQAQPAAVPAPVAVQSQCAACGALSPAGSKFCSACGHSLAAPAPLACAKCGHLNAPGTKFCPECGSSLLA